MPPNRDYRERLVCERESAKAGLRLLHRLRYAYAQQRYEELAGWKTPGAGGPSFKSLSDDRRATDQKTRLVVSRKLGHESVDIVRVNCGS